VYGGGGIMPDYFVPFDTSNYSGYYRLLLNRGIFNRFALNYVDEHRNELLARYPSFEVYNANYQPTQEQLDGLIAYAKEENLEFKEEDWLVSRDQITLLFKGYLARDLWGPGYFFEVFNPSNEVFNKAVEILENPALHHMKLAKVEHE
jgi:carboxyl-terminal processing protease